MRILPALVFVLLVATPARAQQSFYSHDNYTQYELLEPGGAQFAITYFLTERRAGSIFILNQTRSGSAGSDISVFDPRTGKPLKFDYLSGEELARDGTPGRFDPAEHYIRARLAAPVPEGGEGRVKILKTYKDEKSYYVEGDDVVFKRSLGIARNAIVLPKGYRLVSSNVAAQMFTLPDGRLKISFEHAHGYAADVTIRGRKGSPLPTGSIHSEQSFDFTKVLYDFAEGGAVKVTREIIVSVPGPTAFVPNQMSASDVVVIDVDTGKPLELKGGREGRVAQLLEPIAGPGQSARLRLTGTMKNRYVVTDGQFSWDARIDEPRGVFLLPSGFDLVSISVPATVSMQQDGRVAMQVYAGAEVTLPVTIRAAKR
jgi:hypothetical protein